MGLPYFFQQDISLVSGEIELSKDTSKHCTQVLRMSIQDDLLLTDGSGNLYDAQLTKIVKGQCFVSLKAHKRLPKKNMHVTIAISPVKNTSRLEWFIEKATELGVSEIVPLMCDRTEKQHLRPDRLHAIMVSAMLQSQQAWLPNLHGCTTFNNWTSRKNDGLRCIAHCEDGEKLTIAQLPIEENIEVLIGPEGDFTQREIAAALSLGYRPISLGETRLRTETAGMVATALLINGIKTNT